MSKYIFPTSSTLKFVIILGNVKENTHENSLLKQTWKRYPLVQKKKGKRKVQGVPQSQTAALPRPQEEEETDKSK